MADQKISALTAATSLADTDELVIASSGTTKKITAANAKASITAGSQPLDSDLTAIAALTTTSYGRSLLTLADGTWLTPVRRHDYSGTTSYEGWAPAGTAEATASWHLTKIVVASAGTVTVTHATNSWSNHLTASYS